MMMEIQIKKDGILIKSPYFDIKKTLTCGQIFRYRIFDESTFGCIAGDKSFLAIQEAGETFFPHISEKDFFSYWYNFFDLNLDLEKVESTFPKYKYLKKSMMVSRGIRILRQSLWESLISFIISSNNHIPRIQKCIEIICQNYGRKIRTSWGEEYAFPTPEELAMANKDFYREIAKVGYRDNYLYRAVHKILEKEIDLTAIENLPYKDAKKALKEIPGIGEKVANCILVFGCGHLEAFPVDTWIKKAIEELEKEKPFSIEEVGPYGGYIQQYLFYHTKNSKSYYINE